MNLELKEAFTAIKPVCDAVMNGPTPKNVAALKSQACSLTPSAVQEMHLYLVFPLITHLKSPELSGKYSLIKELVDTLRVILEKITIKKPEMFVKYHMCLLNFLFDKKKIGIVTEIPEELELSIIDTLTVMMLNLDMKSRIHIFKTNVLLLAHTIFLAVHIAKLERLRALRLSALNCLMAYTGIHYAFTDKIYHIKDKNLEEAAVSMITEILPGVLAALQDVATCTDNPGHAIVVLALNSITRIMRLAMNDKQLTTKLNMSIEDFAAIFETKYMEKQALCTDKENSVKKAKELKKMSPEWYLMASDKLSLVVKSLVVLQTHEHTKVRKELALLCTGLLAECSRTMQPSMKYILNILITLSRDQDRELSEFCTTTINTYFLNVTDKVRQDTLDKVGECFMENIMCLNKVLNDIESSSKIASLNLLSGYVNILAFNAKPERFRAVLSQPEALTTVCEALIQAANVDTAVSLLANPRIKAIPSPLDPPSPIPPWSQLRLLSSTEAYNALRHLVHLIGNSKSVELVADELLGMLKDMSTKTPGILRLLTWIGHAPKCPNTVTQRILPKYIQHEFWYLPLQVTSGFESITQEETLDPEVYNPRSWYKDSVPGLYEGAIEVRYTDISYSQPRRPKFNDPNYCSSLAEAQRNMVTMCLLTEGVGLFAKKLGDEFHPYMMKVLCMILERVGSKYELLQQVGSKTIELIAQTFDYPDVGELIRCNSDYFSYQVTNRLKKPLHNQSALEILSVVMEHSDGSMLDCLYGIVIDVLMKSCEKYHKKDLNAYLKVFLTFVNFIKKWFPTTKKPKIKEQRKTDLMQDTKEYILSLEKLKNNLDGDDNLEEKFKDRIYDDGDEDNDELRDVYQDMSEDQGPVPKHIEIAMIIVKLCINFIPSKEREKKLLCFQIINNGLQILDGRENDAFPLVHLCWSPLTERFEEVHDPIVLRASFDLLVTMATISRTFIKSRTLKDVIPHLKKFLESSSKQSYLKDIGSSYRLSQTYKLQEAVLQGLPGLVMTLQIEDEDFDQTLASVVNYLNCRQPKPLQELAVNFYKKMLIYDRGAVWYYLRKVCNNNTVLEPPNVNFGELNTVIGTPYEATDENIEKNIKAIFDDS